MRRKNLDHKLIQGYIEEALFKPMEKKDFVKISVGEIAEVAGVHRATFYRHFSSKEDIVERIKTEFFWFLELFFRFSFR